MANEEEINWPYTDSPYLGIRLRTPSGREHPLVNEEELVMIDTGYTGEVFLPKDLYEELGFSLWEEPEPDEFILGDGSKMHLIASLGYILIPKLDFAPFPVRVHRAYKEEQDTDRIIIGTQFIKRFKLLLDGPTNKVRIL